MKKLHEHTEGIRKLPISKIMEKPVTIHKGEHLLDFIKLLEKHDVSCLVVVDDKGDFIGDIHESDLMTLAIDPKDLSEYDVVGFFGTKFDRELFGDTVEDLMKSHESTCLPTDTVETVMLEMWKEGLRAVPVVDKKDKLVGLVTIDTFLSKVLEKLRKVKKG